MTNRANRPQERQPIRTERTYLNGTQSLVRILTVQHELDQVAGIHTAGFVSGYRGSPLAGVDTELEATVDDLQAANVRFEPGLNEELAATAVRGTQMASVQQPTTDGVYAMWYGKGPGVDRSCDALKHGNYGGVSRRGGVLVAFGDDHGCKSSSLPHQSELALAHCGIPVLAPSSVQELVDYGLAGWALSRYAGCWMGLKCTADVVSAAASIDVTLDRFLLNEPSDPPDAAGRWVGAFPLPLEQERSLYTDRFDALHRMVRANQLDRVRIGAAQPRIGIVAAGKTYGDVRQALANAGIDHAEAVRLGVAVYKPSVTWPLEPVGLRAFAADLEALWVVEEKHPLLEQQVASMLYSLERRPRLLGKRDSDGRVLLPTMAELDPHMIESALRRWLGLSSPARAGTIIPLGTSAKLLARSPAFCAGCPHNTSTQLPDGSVAMGGIGCHGMATMLPDRPTLGLTQMGGEGATWIGTNRYSSTRHIFQNMGDGTFVHSGSLAVRAAVAANVNMTYKILVNGAVGMTGGQTIEGHRPLDTVGLTESIVAQLRADGVSRIEVVADDPGRLRRKRLGRGVRVHSRDDLDRLQRELREVPGVTALVYDQGCAAEARRLRKRGKLADPPRRVVINSEVCEGCGDCNVQSNCSAVEPLETPHGRKRTINQDSCNKDFSCLRGYCPSFAVVEGARLRPRAATLLAPKVEQMLSSLPEPHSAATTGPTRIVFTGIGGTGVVTAAAVLGRAAALEGKSCSVLDQIGGAQMNGAVMSHVQISDTGDDIHVGRVPRGQATVVLGGDIVTTATAEALAVMSQGQGTVAIVNQHVTPTAEFALTPDLDLRSSGMEALIVRAVGADHATFIDSTTFARTLLGADAMSNMFLVGYALQLGLLAVSAKAVERAIELHGIKVEANLRAVRLGRLAAEQPTILTTEDCPDQPDVGPHNADAGGLEALVEDRYTFLVDYDGRDLADRYRHLVDRVASRERKAVGAPGECTRTVADVYFRLLSIKDEYEVARLWTQPAFRQRLDEMFEPGYRVKLNLAPQRFVRKDKHTGRTGKRTFGPWVFPMLRLLATLRPLRGSALDIFGQTKHRRRERQLIAEYEELVAEVLATLSADNHTAAVAVLSAADGIRGYGAIKDATITTTKAVERELLARYQEVRHEP